MCKRRRTCSAVTVILVIKPPQPSRVCLPENVNRKIVQYLTYSLLQLACLSRASCNRGKTSTKRYHVEPSCTREALHQVPVQSISHHQQRGVRHRKSLVECPPSLPVVRTTCSSYIYRMPDGRASFGRLEAKVTRLTKCSHVFYTNISTHIQGIMTVLPQYTDTCIYQLVAYWPRWL